MNITLKKTSILSLCVFLIVVHSTAAAHDDILVTKIDGGTKTGLGAIEVAVNQVELDTIVFEGVFIAGQGGNDFARDEPGFNAPSSLNPLYGGGGDLTSAGATPLDPNDVVNIALRTFSFNGNVSDLFYWNGAGAVNFQPATGVTPSLSVSSTVAGANGTVDFHPDFEINAGVGTAANGVYLMSFTQQVVGTDGSDPGFIVWLADSSITDETIAEDTEEDIENGLAFTFFEDAVDHVVSVVPEPASVVLVLLGVCGVAVKRSRNIS